MKIGKFNMSNYKVTESHSRHNQAMVYLIITINLDVSFIKQLMSAFPHYFQRVHYFTKVFRNRVVATVEKNCRFCCLLS